MAALSLILGTIGVALAAPAGAAITTVTPSAPSASTNVGVPIDPITFSTDTADGAVTYASTTVPSGMTLTEAGELSGAPDAAGEFVVTVTATDAGLDPIDPADDTTLSTEVTISAVVASLDLPIQQAVVGAVGLALTTATLTPSDFPAAPVYAISPATLPDGVTFDTATGIASGTPLATFAETVFTITASSGAVSATSEVAISVPDASLAPASTTLAATLNSSISDITFTATGFAATAGFAISPTALPTGLTFDAATGTLSGTPTVAWPATTYTITAVTADQSATATLVMSVSPADLAPKVLTGTVATAFAPTPAFLDDELTAAGLVAPFTFAVSPSLPSGMTLNAATGIISGTPGARAPPTVHTVTVTDTNLATATGQLTFTVEALQLAPPVIYFAQSGTTSGSLRVLFLGPAQAPIGQVYAAEVYDATGSSLVKTVRPMTSLTEITGLTPGTTYSVVIVADGSDSYLGSRSAPKTGTVSLTGAKVTPPTITSISGGPAIGSIVVSFTKSPNAPIGVTYTAQVYDEDQVTLVKSVPNVTSPVTITGLTPGLVYYVFIAADATATTLESLSRGRTVKATGQSTVATTAVSAATVANSTRPVTNIAPGSSTTALGAGWLRPTAAQAAKAKKVVVKKRPTTKRGKAPTVKVPLKRVVALRLKGMLPQALITAEVRLDKKWVSLGSARATWGGKVNLPPFKATKKGKFLVRLTATGQDPTYIKVTVKKKRKAAA